MKMRVDEFPEVERYELREGSRYHFELNRREFVQILGAGVLIGWIVEADAGTGAALDHHLVTVMDQLAHAPGNETDTVFVGFPLLGDADPHYTTPLTRAGGRAVLPPRRRAARTPSVPAIRYRIG